MDELFGGLKRQGNHNQFREGFGGGKEMDPVRGSRVPVLFIIVLIKK